MSDEPNDQPEVPEVVPRQPNVNVQVMKKVCLKVGHKYVEVEDSDHRQTLGEDTLVRRSFICTACGDVINPVVAMWENWVSKRKR